MKISWGTGITISIVVFTIISLAFIYYAFNQEVNLVRDDYYEAELQFNEKMEVIKRTADLSQDIQVNLFNDNLEIVFPEEFDPEDLSGTILLYRPSDRRLDKVYNILPDSANIQRLKKTDLVSGLWKVRLNWIADSTKYYSEHIIMVN